MTKRQKPDAPCDHFDDLIGTVCAGDIKGSGPFCSVATCARCVKQSQGYVQMVTDLAAQDLLTYTEARKARA